MTKHYEERYKKKFVAAEIQIFFCKSFGFYELESYHLLECDAV
jgi:hypothetical protein